METKRFDILVAGGGTAGWMAALAAAREGKEVLLVERKGYLGGVLGSGLAIYGFHDVTHRRVVKGYADEFVERLSRMGGADGYTLLDLWHASMVTVDAALVKPLLFEMLHEAGVRTLLYGQICEVRRNGRTLEGVVVQEKTGRRPVLAKMFVDATGDAVLPFLGGLPFEACEEQQPPTLVLRIENVDVEELRTYLIKHPEHYVNWRMLPGKKADEAFLRTCRKFLIFPDLLKEFPFVGDYMPLINRVMFHLHSGRYGRDRQYAQGARDRRDELRKPDEGLLRRLPQRRSPRRFLPPSPAGFFPVQAGRLRAGAAIARDPGVSKARLHCRRRTSSSGVFPGIRSPSAAISWTSIARRTRAASGSWCQGPSASPTARSSRRTPTTCSRRDAAFRAQGKPPQPTGLWRRRWPWDRPRG